MRIARALALAGIGSRRKCEEHVVHGAVSLNGEVVRDLGRQIDLENDELAFRGRALRFEKMIYYIMNKPKGFTTTAADPHAEKTVFELLPKNLVRATAQPNANRRRVFPVGRLDKESIGLLLFTNDGDLANRLTHPRYGVDKWYAVRLNRAFEAGDAQKLLGGISLFDGMVRAREVRKVTQKYVEVMLQEGKKREIRRMFKALGYQVIALCRFAFGPLTLGLLGPGEGRFLRPDEIHRLRKSTG